MLINHLEHGEKDYLRLHAMLTRARTALPKTTKRNHRNDETEITQTNESAKTRRPKQAKPPNQAKTPKGWKQVRSLSLVSVVGICCFGF